MKFHASRTVVAAFLALCANSMLFGQDHKDDETLKFYLNRSDVVLDCEIKKISAGIVTEIGVVNRVCDVAVSKVLKGDVELAGKELKVLISRFERNESEKHQAITVDSNCVFFLNKRDNGTPELITADMWFGIQHSNPSMVRSLKRIANKPAAKFVLARNDFGEDGKWTIEYVNRVYAELVRLMDNPNVTPPTDIKILLEKIPDSPALGGYATQDQIGFQASSWPRERFRLWILAHELANLFANHYANSGGFPADWWSNGRSPFPVYVAAIVTKSLGEDETAKWLRTVDAELEDQKLYWALNEAYGFELFAKFFRLVRQDGLDFNKIGDAWPAADKRRSAYAIAYLSIAAGKNLAPLFRKHGIGTKPEDWDSRHPEKPFAAYSISDKEVDDLISRRKLILAKGTGTEDQKKQLEDFVSGKK